MFKLITGNNGRSVYAGYVENSNASQETFELTGIEWDKDNKKEIERRLFLKKDIDLPETELVDGDYIIVTMLPSRKDPDRGTAEEIAKQNQAIRLQNDKGNVKIAFIGTVAGKKWNSSGSVLSLSIRGVKDVDGVNIGSPYTYYDRFGDELTSYYINISLFKNSKSKIYTAEKGDKDFEKGKKAVFVVAPKERMYNGKMYQNFMLTKYSIPKMEN